MAGQGHQFPGNFGNNSPVARNFGSGPMVSQVDRMPNSMNNVMGGGPMANPNQITPMVNQMVQQYGTGIQNQMSNMNLQQQIPIANPSPSPGLVSPMSVPMSAGGALSSPGLATNTNPVVNPNMGQQNTATATGTTSDGAAPSQPPQNKEFNTASLCKFGQETVQDIVNRTQDIFQTLKSIQPPNGTTQGTNASNDKKAKVQEQLRTIRLLFKRLRLIYEKCNESCQLPGMEYTHIESLIPIKNEQENKCIEETKTSEAYKLVIEENRELTEQVVLKNKQLKEVINNLRTIIWEINVMLNMRRS